jgi:hypothetical protein
MTASCRSIMSHYQIKCKRGARAVNFTIAITAAVKTKKSDRETNNSELCNEP